MSDEQPAPDAEAVPGADAAVEAVAEAVPDAVAAVEAVVEEQIAFDVNDFPGGARGAIELPVDDVRAHLEGLEAEDAAQQRGFTLRSVAGGWRVYSRSDYAPVVE